MVVSSCLGRLREIKQSFAFLLLALAVVVIFHDLIGSMDPNAGSNESGEAHEILHRRHTSPEEEKPHIPIPQTATSKRDLPLFHCRHLLLPGSSSDYCSVQTPNEIAFENYYP